MHPKQPDELRYGMGAFPSFRHNLTAGKPCRLRTAGRTAPEIVSPKRGISRVFERAGFIHPPLFVDRFIYPPVGGWNVTNRINTILSDWKGESHLPAMLLADRGTKHGLIGTRLAPGKARSLEKSAFLNW